MILEFDIFPESFSAITNKKKKWKRATKKECYKKNREKKQKKVVSNYNMT